MSQFVKKENLTIVIGEYQKDGAAKKQYKTIGELVTMIGDDGNQYQFFKMWGAGGVVEGKVFEQRDDNQQNNNQGQQQATGLNQQNVSPQQMQSAQQGYNQQPQQNNYQNQPNPQNYNGQ